MHTDIAIDRKDTVLNEIQFPDVSEKPVAWGEINLQRADKFKAIVNPETGKVFSIVSKD